MRKSVFSFSLVLLLATVSQAQMMEYAAQVFAQLESAAEELNELGLTVEKVIIYNLDEGRHYTHTASFGDEGLVIGVCDEDCSDLDLEIKRGDEVIYADEAEDDEPVVRIPGEGRYSIRVTMYSCDEEPCYFGIAYFE